MPRKSEFEETMHYTVSEIEELFKDERTGYYTITYRLKSDQSIQKKLNDERLPDTYRLGHSTDSLWRKVDDIIGVRITSKNLPYLSRLQIKFTERFKQNIQYVLPHGHMIENRNGIKIFRGYHATHIVIKIAERPPVQVQFMTQRMSRLCEINHPFYKDQTKTNFDELSEIVSRADAGIRSAILEFDGMTDEDIRNRLKINQ
jgi:ppGpp synthetase/RelA/SpoT-type nucleotidyltranferase